MIFCLNCSYLTVFEMGRVVGFAKWWRESAIQRDFVLVCSVVALIATRTVDMTLFYRFNYEYGYFVWYFSALILPFGYLVMTWPVVLWLKYRTTAITPQMTAFPKYRLAIMGLLDTLFNLTSTFPVQHIGGNLSNVLSQTVLPMNMAISYFVLKTRFKWNHYLGALLVIGGVIVKMSPGLTGDSSPAGWIMLYIGSQVFNAASNAYKEVCVSIPTSYSADWPEGCQPE